MKNVQYDLPFAEIIYIRLSLIRSQKTRNFRANYPNVPIIQKKLARFNPFP